LKADVQPVDPAAAQDCVTQLPDGTRIFDIHTDALDPKRRVPGPARLFKLAIVVFLGAIATIVVILFFTATLGPTVGPLTTLAAIAMIGLFAWKISTDARKATLEKEVIDADPLIVARLAIEFYRGQLNLPARRLVQLFLERGWEGSVIRVISSPDPVSTNPLDVRIEPTELNQVDENFLQFAATGIGRRAEAALRLMDKSDWERWLRRDPQARELAVISLFMIGMAGWSMATRRQIPFFAIAFGVGFILTFIWNLSPLNRQTTNPLIVNGGILVSSSGRRHGYFNYLFRREDAVLVVHRTQGEKWRWIVADRKGGGWVFGDGTQMEVEVLLRAWLSPLPPPPIERLADPA